MMIKQKKTVFEYRHYTLPLNFPVLLLSGDSWRISDQKSERLHFHNCLEIGLCHANSGILEIQEQRLSYKTGDITCIPRYIPHTTYSNKGTESLWSYIFVDPKELFGNLFCFTTHQLESPTLDTQNYKFIMNKETYPKVYNLVLSVIEEIIERKPNYQISVKGHLLSLYVEFLRIQYNNNFHDNTLTTLAKDKLDNISAISMALDYIHKNYMQKISIEELANICHLSESHFRRIFHENTGTTPLDFINRVRIDEACRLLRSTEASIISISEQVGFNSISSFNRCFTKLMGTSPSAWRKQLLPTQGIYSKASIIDLTGWIR